jgi:hypothetical protein
MRSSSGTHSTFDANDFSLSHAADVDETNTMRLGPTYCE